MIQHLTYKEHHRLAYTVAGDPRGAPVLVQHGLIASIDSGALFQPLIDLGARVICIARPGYGASTPYEMKNMAEWGELAGLVVDDLGLESFNVLGISSGAPYAYAIGYRFPRRAHGVYILSGTPALYSDAVLACWPYPVDRTAGLADLRRLAHDLFFSGLAPAALEQADIRDSMANDCFGIGQDFLLRCRDWGFSLGGVSTPVVMHHSRADESVPLAAAELTAAMLPHCRLDVSEKDEHFSPAVLEAFIQTALAGAVRAVGGGSRGG